MLIRIVSDGLNNAEHIDKLIAIDGLPDEWFFERRKDVDNKGNPDERVFLKEPWKMDITENLPYDIRERFQKNPMTVWFETPFEVRPGTTAPADHPMIQWTRTCHGFVLNMQTNAGSKMWQQILDLLDRETPRTQRIPQPRVVGTRQTWMMKPDDVPYVRLTGFQLEVPKEQVQVISVKEVPRPNQYACSVCGDVFEKERAKWMHERRKHGVKSSFAKEGKAVPV